MKGLIRTSSIVILFFGLISSVPVYGINIKGKLPSGVATASAFSVVSSGEVATTQVATSIDNKFTLTVDGKDARVFLIKDNAVLPVLVGIKLNNKVYSVAEAIKKNLCEESGVFGLSVLKKNVSGSQELKLKTVQVDETDAYVMVKGIKSISKIDFKKLLKKYVDKALEVSVNADCSPEGNASSLGLGSQGSGSSFKTLAAESDGDEDGDGLVDELDVDVDGDGILNPYDADTTASTNGFRIFTNLKVGIESTINKNAIPTLTDEEIDTVVRNTQSMAIQVLTENSSGKTAELDCGTLGYCSSGGTGKPSSNSSLSFPDDVDTDSDGFGEITKGGTGDFQLLTGAGTSEIGSGNVLIQTISDSDGIVEETYVTSLAFAFASTPAMTEMVLNEGDATTATFTPSYPVANNGPGTMNDPFTVAPHSGSGDVILKITAYRPQRKGVEGAGEVDLIDIGNSKIVIDIPNGPSSGGAASQGPGGCPVSSYSESDADLTTSGDTLIDAQPDFDSATENDGDGNKTVTFTVNITDCLAKNGATDTLDSGERLKIDLQFKNDTGDNAAQAFYIDLP